MRKHFFRILSLAFVGLFFSCVEQNKDATSNFLSYSQVNLKYAKGFEIYENKDGNETKILVRDLEEEGGILHTIFLNDGVGTQQEKKQFPVPLGDISVASTTHASFMLALGLEKNIKGMAWASYAQNEKIKSQVESGHTINITGSSEIDLEKLLATNSVALTDYPFAMDDNSKLASVDMPVIIVSEYLEESPLARAEWIKFFGALYGKSKEANQIFDGIEKEYLALKKQALSISDRPMVVIGSEQNGVWHMPGADSFISQMINDAGGQYLFDDFKGKSNQQVDLEILVQRAEAIDFWGKVSNEKITKEKLTTESKVSNSIPAIAEGAVFYVNTQTSDYFGDAIMEPHLILKDLVNIFHPKTFVDYEPSYFQMVE